MATGRKGSTTRREEGGRANVNKERARLSLRKPDPSNVSFPRDISLGRRRLLPLLPHGLDSNIFGQIHGVLQFWPDKMRVLRNPGADKHFLPH